MCKTIYHCVDDIYKFKIHVILHVHCVIMTSSGDCGFVHNKEIIMHIASSYNTFFFNEIT